ncbi:unnamed protein product [Protopolystoma xenopodis]|uniref:Uncharacterized protein n=1 Tax=Protopolystoma xenopodis TaxID=117903 RepID=A0A3S5B3X1_9PLAT|nr:unnamed protein product [Protopolystoma xenopodis]
MSRIDKLVPKVFNVHLIYYYADVPSIPLFVPYITFSAHPSVPLRRNMAGSGIYVLTGTVIRDKSGPSTFISYLLAGITAFLNALCYAELASRIPKVGIYFD